MRKPVYMHFTSEDTPSIRAANKNAEGHPFEVAILRPIVGRDGKVASIKTSKDTAASSTTAAPESRVTSSPAPTSRISGTSRRGSFGAQQLSKWTGGGQSTLGPAVALPIAQVDNVDAWLRSFQGPACFLYIDEAPFFKDAVSGDSTKKVAASDYRINCAVIFGGASDGVQLNMQYHLELKEHPQHGPSATCFPRKKMAHPRVFLVKNEAELRNLCAMIKSFFPIIEKWFRDAESLTNYFIRKTVDTCDIEHECSLRGFVILPMLFKKDEFEHPGLVICVKDSSGCRTSGNGAGVSESTAQANGHGGAGDVTRSASRTPTSLVRPKLVTPGMATKRHSTRSGSRRARSRSSSCTLISSPSACSMRRAGCGTRLRRCSNFLGEQCR